MEKNIRVVLADDHAILRQGMRYLFNNTPILVVGEASNGDEAIALVEDKMPDVLVCDIHMPGTDGIKASKILKEKGIRTKILFLSMHDSEEYVMQALNVGASGFLSKDTVEDELLEAVKSISRGGEYFSKDIYAKIVKIMREPKKEPAYKLTRREKEVVQCLMEGLSTKQIADKLCVSEHTVSNHRANILNKLKVVNTAQLIVKVVEEKLVEQD